MSIVARMRILSFFAACLAACLLAGVPVAWASPELAKKLLAAAPSHGERSLGAADAPVILIEYASASCTHCAEFHLDVWPAIKKDFVDTGKVRFVFREFPLDKSALAAFMLARCVPEDKYFATIDLMFRRQASWRANPKRGLFAIAALSGLDAAEAEACLRKTPLAQAIFDSTQTANKEFGVTGTPSFFVNGVYVDGHKEATDLRKAIENALAAVAAP